MSGPASFRPAHEPARRQGTVISPIAVKSHFFQVSIRDSEPPTLPQELCPHECYICNTQVDTIVMVTGIKLEGLLAKG